MVRPAATYQDETPAAQPYPFEFDLETPARRIHAVTASTVAAPLPHFWLTLLWVLASFSVALAVGLFRNGVNSPSPARITVSATPEAISVHVRQEVPSESQGSPAPRPTAVGTTVAPPVPIVHVVRSGETLTSIAVLYGMTVDAIVRANNVTNANLIHPGDRIVIPEAPPR